MAPDTTFSALEFLMREAALFAATGFLVLGLSDFAIDVLWLGRTFQNRFASLGMLPSRVEELPPPKDSGLLAVFVPAWDEAVVIGTMLRHALRTFDHPCYRIYVGCYPNDIDTIEAVREVEGDCLRLIVGPFPGPTTKADCLNRLWQALLDDEARQGFTVKAVILHDAEDVVHSSELRIFDALIEKFDLVQLPVLPLIDWKSRWVAGHYADEFAEAHGKELVVREAIGASLPSAGVGCAFSRAALVDIAARGGGLPFDADSLTEDYELGLKLHMLGRKGVFARVRSAKGDAIVATRGYFPSTIRAAVNQKARWMTGIALSGWERLGWSGGIAERWMRLRDRQSMLAALLLLSGYAALFLWLVLKAREGVTGAHMPPFEGMLATLIWANMALLVWRFLMRLTFVTRAYGWTEGVRSIPRMVTSNLIAMLSAARALGRYRKSRRSGAPHWHKTDHHFPAELPAE